MTGKKSHLSLVGLLICLLTPGSLGQETQWLRYGTSRELGELVGWEHVSSKPLKLTGKRPEGVSLATFKAADPLFAKWPTPMVKAGHVWIALDRSSKNGAYDRLYVDSDGDGRLAGEQAAVPFSTNSWGAGRYRTQFGPVKVVFDGEDGPICYHLKFRCYTEPQQNRLYISSAGYYEGQVSIGGKSRRCMLIDYNANGTFDDTSSDFGQIDRILIAVGNKWDGRFAGKYIEIDGQYYRPRPAHDGAFITFTPLKDVPMGVVRVPQAIAKISLGGECGLLNVHVTDGVGRLPVGTYRLYHWEMQRKDKQGRRWKVAARGWSVKQHWQVGSDKELTLDIGEPLNCTLSARKQGTRRYQFNQEIKGRLGEQLEITRNGSRPPAPKIQIKNEDGSFEHTYRLEYG